MRRANIVSGIVLSLFGVIMLVAIIPWQIEAGPDGMMSPRLAPQLMMIFVIGLSILLVVRNYAASEEKSDGQPIISRSEIAALLKIGAVFAVSLALFLFVSPLAAGIAIVVGSLLALGERRPLILVLMPAGLMLALWLVFYKVLGTVIL